MNNKEKSRKVRERSKSKKSYKQNHVNKYEEMNREDSEYPKVISTASYMVNGQLLMQPASLPPPIGGKFLNVTKPITICDEEHYTEIMFDLAGR